MSVINRKSGISDKKGNLLFYTDVQTVWNKNHQIMEITEDLAGEFGINFPVKTKLNLINGEIIKMKASPNRNIIAFFSNNVTTYLNIFESIFETLTRFKYITLLTWFTEW